MNDTRTETFDDRQTREMRDVFAAAALAGISRSFVEGTVDDYLPEFVAADCYKLADAMIAERMKARAEK